MYSGKLLSPLISLEHDTNETVFAYKKEILFIRKLIMEGKWIEAEQFFKPLEANKEFNYKGAIFALKKQRLLESLENSDDNVDSEGSNLEKLIEEIQAICSNEEFNEVLSFLNGDSFKTIEKYKHWTPIQGKFNCFETIKGFLGKIYPVMSNKYTWNNTNLKVPNGLLVQVMNIILSIANKQFGKEKKITTLVESIELFIQNSDSYSFGNSDSKVITFNPLKKNVDVKGMQIQQQPKESGQVKTQLPKQNIEVKPKAPKGRPVNQKGKKTNTDIDNTNDNVNYNSPYAHYNYDISSYKLDLTITDTHPIRTSCFSPKGDFFALGTNSKSLKIYDMNPVLNQFTKRDISKSVTMPLVFEKSNHHLGSLYCLDWSMSGKLIASGSNDKMLKIIVVQNLDSWQSKSNILELSIEGHKGTIRSVVFDPISDHSLYSGGTVDTSIFAWDTEKGVGKAQLIGHTDNIHTIKWSNDLLLLGSSGKDKCINFWDTKDNKIINTINASSYDEINDISIYTTNHNINNTIIAAAHLGGIVTIWDYNKKTLHKQIGVDYKSEMRSIAFSPDGKYLLVGGFDNKISIFDVNNDYNSVEILEHSDKVVSVKWHPENPIIVSTSADKTAKVWLPQAY